MELINLKRDITEQVKFYQHIASFMVGEVDAEEGDEDAKALDAHGCGDCISFTIYGHGDDQLGILIPMADARKLGEFLIATADL